MSLSAFIEIYEKGSSEIIQGSALINALKAIDFDHEIYSYVNNEFQSQVNDLNPEKLNVLMKVVYVEPSTVFTESILEFLNHSFNLSKDDLFSVIAEIEFSFTVLGMIKDKRAIPVLERFISEPVSWDEGNIANAAKYGIQAIKS